MRQTTSALVGVLDPLQHHAGVEAAGVEQQDPPHLGGVGLVAGGAGGLRSARPSSLGRSDAAAAAFFFGRRRRRRRASSFRSSSVRSSFRSVVSVVDPVVVVVVSVARRRRDRPGPRSSCRRRRCRRSRRSRSTRPTITAIRPATSRRMLPCGLPSSGRAWSHHPGRVLVHAIYSSGPSIASSISLVSSISKPLRSRCSISSRPAPETAICVASRRAPAELERRRSRRLLGPEAASTGLRCDSRRGAAAAGGSSSSARDAAARRRCDRRGRRLLEMAPRLLLGVVDHLGGGLLGRLDDRREALGACRRSAARGSEGRFGVHRAA